MRVHALAEVERPVTLPAVGFLRAVSAALRGTTRPPGIVVSEEPVTTGMLLAALDLPGFELQIVERRVIQLRHTCGDWASAWTAKYATDVHLDMVINAALQHNEVCK